MNPDILDEKGQPITKRSKRIIRHCKFVWRNRQIWSPILSIIAIIISGLSVWQSMKNNEVTRRLNKLDLRPRFMLCSLFKSIGSIPPHWELTNIGPIEAVQVKVEMFSHRYFPKTKKIQASLQNSSNTTIISKIDPQETRSCKFKKGWLEESARVQEPPQNNVMEIMITYRRPQDLKEYKESAFYFVNPDGLWVPEGEYLLKGELYESIKKALFIVDRGQFSVYRELSGDPLHSNQ